MRARHRARQVCREWYRRDPDFHPCVDKGFTDGLDWLALATRVPEIYPAFSRLVTGFARLNDERVRLVSLLAEASIVSQSVAIVICCKDAANFSWTLRIMAIPEAWCSGVNNANLLPHDSVLCGESYVLMANLHLWLKELVNGLLAQPPSRDGWFQRLTLGTGFFINDHRVRKGPAAIAYRRPW